MFFYVYLVKSVMVSVHIFFTIGGIIFYMALVIPVTDIGVIAASLLFIYYIKRIAHGIKILIVNSITGFILLLVGNLAGVGVSISPLVVFEVALGGVFSALMIIFLHLIGFTTYPI